MIIFLDIDGVLTSARTWYALDRHYGGMIWRALDPIAVGLINGFCKDYKYQIVISSSWRTHPDCWSDLKKGGLNMNLIHSDWRTTSEQKSWMRGYEIEAWLKRNNKLDTKYIILDDDQDFLPEQKPRLVLTNSDNGLMMDDYRKMRNLLIS